MPIDKSKYPANWKQISKQTIENAHNKCELCYAPNGVKVIRLKILEATFPWYETVRTKDFTKIVLTVHHIDCDPQNNHPYNLIALCQKCHLRLDKYKHFKNRIKKIKD
jgi:5-methylcytosine-specific restriction endonuclease McrA